MSTGQELTGQVYAESKKAILGFLIENIDQKLLEQTDQTQLRRRVEELVDEKLRMDRAPYSRAVRNRLVGEIADEILGYGPIESLLRDPTLM